MSAPTRTCALAAGALLSVGLLGGCTSAEDGPDETSSASSSSESKSSDTGKKREQQGSDQSKQVFDAYTKPKPLGSATKGDQTFEVLEVKDTPQGTLLTFRLRAPEEMIFTLNAEDWGQHPVLVDGKTGYQPLTVAKDPYEEGDAEQYKCVCTGQMNIHPGSVNQQALYESLPKDVSKVKVKFQDFDPITVKVSR